MEQIKPKGWEKAMHEEGIKNPADIWDNETFEQVAEEIENTEPDVQELLAGGLTADELLEKGEAKLSPELKETLQLAREFCADVSNDFCAEFLRLLREYRENRREIPQKNRGLPDQPRLEPAGIHHSGQR